MKHDASTTELLDSLQEMGYTREQQDRVVNAGITNVDAAIEFLDKNAFQSKGHASHQIPTAHQTNNQSTSSSSMKVSENPNTVSRGIGNARDSIDLGRIQTSNDVPTLDVANDSDLQKAIMLSRREQEERDTAEALKRSKQQVSLPAEDPDFMRAIEESLRDNHPRSGNDRGVTWHSRAFNDIKDRMRTNLDQPVGLKNIGNTCYLNSLLQVYYYLPDFRRAIMSFLPPQGFLSSPQIQIDSLPTQNAMGNMVSDDPAGITATCVKSEPKIASPKLDHTLGLVPNGEEFVPNPHVSPQDDPTANRDKVEKKDERSANIHAVEFVVELQKLFAAMALGNQNCVDPSGVMHAMRDQEGNPIVIGAQQDASEFNHLFLDIVERGLKCASANGSASDTGIEIVPVSDTVKVEDSQVGSADRMEMGDMNIPSANQDADRGGTFTEEVVKMDEGNGDGYPNMDTADGEKMEAVLSANVTDTGNPNKPTEKNIVKELFTTRFRQELQICVAGDSVSEPSEGEERMTVNEGETNAVIVDATTKDLRNLHSGLDDFTYAYVDTVVSEAGTELSDGRTSEGVNARMQGGSNKGVKRVWFTRMAPVVVIYLQRVRYNRDIFQAEKVYDRYEFETNISFDRYMEKNKRVANRAREQVFKLREEKLRITNMLNKLKEFPYVAENESPKHTAKKARKEDFSSAIKRVEMRLSAAIGGTDEMLHVENVNEDMIQVSREVLQAVIERDAKACESMEQSLRVLEADEKKAYRGLQGTRYRLHGVLVHDGAPSGGHYWTFIRNWGGIQAETEWDDKKGWLKLSDSNVSEVSEEDMLKWAVGGKSLASAYCLIYVSTRGAEQGTGGGGVDGKSPAEESKMLLPKVRIEEVELENVRFSEEVWSARNRNGERGA